VKRIVGWMRRWNRLVGDYARCCDVIEAMIRVSLNALLFRRVAHR
jgi:putative transposase